MRAAAIVERRSRLLVAATLAGFALVALAARARPAPAVPDLAVQKPSAPRTPSATALPPADRFSKVRPPAHEHFRLPWSLVELILAATVLLALIGLVLALWPRLPTLVRRRRSARTLRRAAEPAPDDLARSVSHVLRAAIAQVAQGQVRDGIILCWHRLEETAGAVGLPRSPAETSTDLVTRLLACLPVSPEPLNRLAALYREARFSSHPLGAEAVAQARSDLAQLRAELAAAPSLGPVAEPQPHEGEVRG